MNSPLRIRESLLLAAACGMWLGACAEPAATEVSSPAPGATLIVEPAAPACVPATNILLALGMIETGNDDKGVGRAGEVSRYQILPAIWRCYTESQDYSNPRAATDVASRHWTYLAEYFRRNTGREATPFDMYVLWNTRLSYYASKGFDRARISPVIQDRARRFSNLVAHFQQPARG